MLNLLPAPAASALTAAAVTWQSVGNYQPQSAASIATAAPSLYDASVGDTATGYSVSSTGLYALWDMGSPVPLSGFQLQFTNAYYCCAAYSSTDGVNWTALPNPVSGSKQAFSVTARYVEFILCGSPSLTDARLYDSSGALVLGPGQGAAPPPPAAPAGLTATGGNGQVILSWTASTGATSYNLYRGTAPGAEAATPYRTGLAGTSYTDSSVAAGSLYSYEVTALNASGESPFSGETPPAGSTAPAPPPTVATFTLSSSAVQSGQSTVGTVTLSAPAPAAGQAVALSSGNSAAIVPASVTVAAGTTAAAFSVTTTAVSALTTCNISASANGVTQTAPLTVGVAGSTPPPAYWVVTFACDGSTDTTPTGSFQAPYTWPLTYTPTSSQPGYVSFSQEAGYVNGQPPTANLMADCTGAITPILTWTPGYPGDLTPPPASVSAVVNPGAWNDQYYFYTSSYPGAAHEATDGFGDPTSDGDNYFGCFGYHVVSQDNSDLQKVVMLPGIPLHSRGLIPSSAGATEITTWVSLQVYPAMVTLSGTTKDSAGNDDILVGQNCTPSLTIPGLSPNATVVSPDWTVSGDTYESFDIGAGQETGSATPYPDPNPPLVPYPFYTPPTFYWKDNGLLNLFAGSAPETISVSAPINYTSGNVSTYIGTITATKTVNVWTPDEYDAPVFNGVPQTNPQLGTVGLIEDQDDVVSNASMGNSFGFDLLASVVTPDPFTSGGTSFGDWA